MGNIIVMGGSFNPPTVAHLKLMQAALDQMPKANDTENRGVFVPSSDAYVRRKMGKQQGDGDKTVLPESLRVEMLESFQQHDWRITVDSRELGTTEVRGHTVATLQAIQSEHPEDTVYFIFGGDKIKGLARWRSFEAMATQFRIIVFSRGDADPLDVIRHDEILSRYESAFVVLQQPEGLEGISSTAVRNRIRDRQAMDGMLTHEVYTMLLAYLNRRDNTILCFQGQHLFLSNFYEGTAFLWNGLTYHSAEAAFQSAKCLSQEERKSFCQVSPAEAKRKGRRVPLCSDWELVKDGIMYEIVREKFKQDQSLAERLLATGDCELIEGNTWGDQYWGVDLCTMQGKNKLGQILMSVRDELKALSEKHKKTGWTIVDEYWMKKNLPETVKQFIEEWTKRLLPELKEWPNLYYSRSVAILFDYNGNKYEIKPSAFGLPIDAQAVMDKHQKEMANDLETRGCSGIMCFGEID